ncbi:MAG: glycosyltransferase [Candidatus Brocadiales bacterium]|nr:glycosyltransferase [Candidatus Bathyanammoxibius sp.]
MIRVAFLHKSNTGVAHYRLWQPAKYLSRLDDFTVMDFPPDKTMPILTVEDYANIGQSVDLIVAERPHRKEEVAALGALKGMFGVKIILDCDDDIYSVHEHHAAHDAYKLREGEEKYIVRKTRSEVEAGMLKRNGFWVSRDGEMFVCVKEKHLDYHGNFEACMEFVDALTTTTNRLVELYSSFGKPVYLLKNCIDFELWPKMNRANKRPVVGWAGANAHKGDLMMLKEPMLRLLDRHKNVTFDLMGLDCPFKGPEGRITGGRNRAVPIQDYFKTISKWKIDIGVAPLERNEFNLAKSSLRWLEYSALGVPSVCSALPEFCEMIGPNEYGRAVETSDGWFSALDELVRHGSLRDELGAKSYNYVRQNHCQGGNINHWADAYREVLDG